MYYFESASDLTVYSVLTMWIDDTETKAAASISEATSGGSKYYSKGAPVYESHTLFERRMPSDCEKRLGECNRCFGHRGRTNDTRRVVRLSSLIQGECKRSIDDVLSRLKLHLRKTRKLRAADFGSADVRRYKAARRMQAQPQRSSELSIPAGVQPRSRMTTVGSKPVGRKTR